MRIIQLTDLHIGEEGEDTFKVDVRGNFLKALRWLKASPPDHLVLSGDLCYLSGKPEIYDWIRNQLENFPCPVWFMAGNHDNPLMLAKAFGLEHRLHGNELYFTEKLGGREFVFLDTATYEVSEAQQTWLKSLLDRREDPVYVFMHHPPTLMGTPFMDGKYPLRNWAAVKDIFLSCRGAVYVFSGHYHIERSVHLKNLHIFVTPSTFFQIGQFSDEFQVDHYRIGWRELVWKGEEFQTAVRYLEP